MTTTAKIRAKGLSATGVTEDLAAQMFNSKGSRYMAIVELKVDEVHEKSDGDRRVDLVIAELEPVVDGDLNGQLDEHVRDIWKALYENRLRTSPAGDDQLPLDPDDGPAPAVADIIQQGQPFIVDEDEDDLDDTEDDADEDTDDVEDDQDDQDDEASDTATVTTVPNPFASVPS